MAQEQMSHSLNLEDRKTLTMTGVTEVASFEDTAAVLHTCMGTLIVQGRELQLKNLSQDGGRVEVDGLISSIAYEELRPPRGWLSRLLG